MTESDGIEAENLAAVLRKKGIVLVASDLLILTVARRLGAQLLHHDADFNRVLRLPGCSSNRVG
jgi:predicted nucleic acid-binding protein